MLGFELWLVLAAVMTLAVVGWVALGMKSRPWVYRLLVGGGVLCLIWGLMPMFGGGGMNQYLVVGAIVACGFLVLSESTADGPDS